MNISELPEKDRLQLETERKSLHLQNRSDSYNIIAYNKAGTRYFKARRIPHPWYDDRGRSMPFGGGTHWTVAYGAVQFRAVRNPLGGTDYELCDGKRYAASPNGTAVPNTVETKKAVMKILKAIGEFPEF